MICVEVRKTENRYEAGATLLGSERPFGQVHLLWKVFGLEGEEDEGIHFTSNDDGDSSDEEEEDGEDGTDGETEDEDEDEDEEQP